MAPRKRAYYLPLLLILSLSSLCLFSLLHSPSTLSSPPLNNQISPNPNTTFTFTIKLLTYNRLSSLSRCLASLARADYGTDKVNLHIFIDHFRNNTETDVDLNLNNSRVILDFVDGIRWQFGEKLVHYRTSNVGLQAQWLEAWWPISDHDFAFVVEDDLEVSPLYYKFLRGLIMNYYYNPKNFNPSIYGASLQRPRFVPGKHGNKMHLDNDTRLFLYQLVGTWGQLLFPRPWKEFRHWYDTHKAKDMKPILQGMVTTGWYKRMGERIWTPWFIKFIHLRGYYNLYTNFLHERALSISHRDAGVNYGKTAGPDSYLLDKITNLMEMQPLSKLKWYDFCFRKVLPDKIIRSLNELEPVLHSQQKRKTILLVSLVNASQAVARNLLCHFERLNIQNYILMGPKSEFLLDLARRGHPVIDMDQFFNNLQVMNLQEPRNQLIKEMLVMAYSVKKTLELGYNVWVIDGNIVPVSGSLFDSTNSAYYFHIGNSFRIFFARSSSTTRKNWDETFISKVIRAKTLKSNDLISSGSGHFMYAVSEVIGQMGYKIKSLNERGFSAKIDSGNGKTSSLSDGTEMVFWSGEMGFDLIRKRLEELGMWAIDSDMSCTAVICHGS